MAEDEQKALAKDGQSIKSEQSEKTADDNVQPKPEWLVKTEKLQEAVKQGLGAQVVWKSDDQTDCEPELIGEKHDASIWPLVIEEPPINFRKPKMMWHGPFRGWIDNDVVEQGQQIMSLDQNIKDLRQKQNDVSQSLLKDHKQTATLQGLVINSNSMIGAVVGQMGKFSAAITKMSDAFNKLNANVQSLQTSKDSVSEQQTEPTQQTSQPTAPNANEGDKNA